LIDAAVDDIGQLLPPHQFQIFADAVKNDDGVIIGVADQRKDRGDHGKRYLLIRQGKCTYGDQGIVKYRDHGRQAVNPFKAEAEINQHSCK